MTRITSIAILTIFLLSFSACVDSAGSNFITLNISTNIENNNFELTNNDDFDYRSCRLSFTDIDNTYIHESGTTLPPDSTFSLTLTDFKSPTNAILPMFDGFLFEISCSTDEGEGFSFEQL